MFKKPKIQVLKIQSVKPGIYLVGYVVVVVVVVVVVIVVVAVI